MSDNYSIVVWHKDDLNGHHNCVLMGAKTLAKLGRDFRAYMERPPIARSFDERNLVQVYRASDATYLPLDVLTPVKPAPAPFVDVAHETAYGATQRLSFVVRVF
jgi:hypothetical protein